jgi:LPXTG-site transpeptidase (sortase) family protein
MYKIARVILSFLTFLAAVLLFILVSGVTPGLAEKATYSPVSHTLPLSAVADVRISIESPMTHVTKSAVITTPIMSLKSASARLLIPKLGVNATIKDMGLTASGAMAVPNNRVDVGWYSLGTRPGEVGSAVIGGHNYWNGTGVFVHLQELVIGDSLSVVSAEGVTSTFVVREMRSYNPTDDAEGIFLSSSGTHLNLITCSGVWDSVTNSYTERYVVFADAL